ncbi:MAG TPA: hypothetical protein VHC69_11945 [Polyangiaceae bacterium]|nr:hypothetical protein [Polyangiaceae bacterium]
MKVGPWLFGPRLDLAAFTGSAAVALALVALRRCAGWPEGLPEWGWVAFVLGVDVAHVYATLFRTYLDGAELRRHRFRYFGLPAVLYLASVALHLAGGPVFFRALAYLAVLHFVRQQVGWAALYRARGPGTPFDKVVDDAAVYAATGYPLLYWHAHLDEKRFAWLIQGDFVDVRGVATALLGPARLVWGVALAVFLLRQLAVVSTERRLPLGKIALVGTTAATWYVGVVGSTGDFDFTVTNVLTHGVPYMVLLFVYGRAAQSKASEPALGAAILARGAVVFVAFLVLCAVVEEALWDRLVWHDHEWLFGATDVSLGRLAASLVVPLLALPQLLHYALDGLLWKRREPALALRPGFVTRYSLPSTP